MHEFDEAAQDFERCRKNVAVRNANRKMPRGQKHGCDDQRQHKL